MSATPVELSGQVVREVVAKGSKSERTAVTLKAEDGSTYVLRRQGGPAFGDESLDVLVGKRVMIDGVAIGDTLIIKALRQSG